MSKITKTYTVERKGDWIVASTPAFDRDKDRVMPQGINTENFQKNPALFYGHNYTDPWAVAGRVAEWKIEDNRMIFRPELREPVNEADPMTIIRSLWDSGLLRAASIGFIPRKGTKNEAGGMDYTDVELLEISITPLPANQEALRLAMKALKTRPVVKSPDYRLPDESVDACNARKFAELMEANPELSEEEARAMAAEMCAQEAPADQPSDAPSDAPSQDEQQNAKSEGDMAGALQELGGHLQAAAELVNALLQMAAPQDAPQDAPADMPAEPMQEGKRISVRLAGKELTTIPASVSINGVPVTKRGRVLSAGNESKLRTAHGAIGEVLAQISESEPEQASKGANEEEALAAVLGDLVKAFRK